MVMFCLLSSLVSRTLLVGVKRVKKVQGVAFFHRKFELEGENISTGSAMVK